MAVAQLFVLVTCALMSVYGVRYQLQDDFGGFHENSDNATVVLNDSSVRLLELAQMLKVSLLEGPPALSGQDPDMNLFDEFQKHLSLDPFKAAVIAGEKCGMGHTHLTQAKFDGKVRPAGDFTWVVKWFHSQRKVAGRLGRIFEHRWDGGNDGDATNFDNIEDLAKLLTRDWEDEVRFTWALAAGRLVIGVVEDILELGSAHLNLVTSIDEEVYIAGEGRCKFGGSAPPAFTLNFLSGTFTYLIGLKYAHGQAAHEDQWAPVIENIFTISSIPAQILRVSMEIDLNNKESWTALKKAMILSDKYLPTKSSREPICQENNVVEGEAYLKFCVCRRAEPQERSLSVADGEMRFWCDGSPCTLEAINEKCKE